MSSWKLLDSLIDWIELLISCHPQGWAVLLGEAQPPSPEQIHAMMNTRRLPSEGKPATRNNTSRAERLVWDEESFLSVVNQAYGWEHITEVCRGFREANSKFWDVVADHTRYVGNSSNRIGSQLGYVAVRHGLAPDTVTRYRREFAPKLARAILCPPTDSEDFKLLPG